MYNSGRKSRSRGIHDGVSCSNLLQSGYYTHIVPKTAIYRVRNEKQKAQNLDSGRVCNGAGNRNRTHNLLITNQLLCQLSYASEITF